MRMTGKEALKEWIVHYRIDCHKYCGDSFLEKLKVVEKDLDKLDKVEEKLTKYERAFEILKDKLAIEPMKDEKECWFYFKNVYSNGYTDYVDLNNDEHELLEELMKGEKKLQS